MSAKKIQDITIFIILIDYYTSKNFDWFNALFKKKVCSKNSYTNILTYHKLISFKYYV